MPGLAPGIHVFATTLQNKTWMAGTSPAMANISSLRLSNRNNAVPAKQLREMRSMKAALIR